MQTVLSSGFGQAEFSQLPARRRVEVPQVRPAADAELEEVFLRAAVAWARWRERRAWGR